MKHYDVMVIGGGPGGYTAAIQAAKAGKKTALFEKEHLGGVCLNEGCIPTKYLAEKAEELEMIRRLTKSQIVRDPGCFSFREIQKGKAQVSEKLVSGVAFLLKQAGVDVITGKAEWLHDRTVSCAGEDYEAEYLILATGARPMMLPVPGVEYCISSREALKLDRIPGSMVVIGGGVIGLEMATAYAAYGTEVTILELASEILPGETREAVGYVLKSMKKQGIRVANDARLLRVERRGEKLCAVYKIDSGTQEILAEQVLMATGRGANLEGIHSEELGLKLDRNGFVETDSRMRTNLEHVYAIGDITGHNQLASIAYSDAARAIGDIMGAENTAEPGLVPTCVHTIPCLASVGDTPEEAKAKGLDPVVGTFSYGANGMALAEGAEGTVYVVMDRQTTRTLGVTVAGSCAAELIALAARTVADGTTLEEWQRTVITHPSLSEMLREAALDAFGKSVHKA